MYHVAVVLFLFPLLAAGQAVTRTDFVQPFNEESFWNVPIGGGAAYVDNSKLRDGTSTVTARLGASNGYATYGSYICRTDQAPPQGQVRDVTVLADGGGSEAAGTNLGTVVLSDNGAGVHDPATGHCRNVDLLNANCDCQISSFDGANWTELYKARPWKYFDDPNDPSNFYDPPDTVVGRKIRVHAADGPGWDPTSSACNRDWGSRAAGTQVYAGLLRTEILSVPGEPIGHALAVELGAGQFAANGTRTTVAPAFCKDGTSDFNVGDIPYGTLMAIPPAVDCAAITSTDSGQRVCEAFQQYGGYAVDRGGNVDTGGNRFAIEFDQHTEGTDQWRVDILADMPAIRQEIRIIPSCDETSPVTGCHDPRTQLTAKGGGTALAPNYKAAATSPPPAPPPGYDAFFLDEFNSSGSAMDPRPGDCSGEVARTSDCGSHWTVDTQRNNDMQCNREHIENMEVSGGTLKIRVTKAGASFTCTNPHSETRLYNHHGGNLRTAEYLGDFLVGRSTTEGVPINSRIEVRFRGPYASNAPPASVEGGWAGIWLVGRILPNGPGWPISGEIDGYEQLGREVVNQGLNRAYFSLHRCTDSYAAECTWDWPTGRSGQGLTLDLAEDPASDWRTLVIEWDKGQIQSSLDGVLMERMLENGGVDKPGGFLRSDPDWQATSNPRSWPYDNGEGNEWVFLLSSPWSGDGSWGGSGRDETIFDNNGSLVFEVDYARIYTKKTAPPVPPLAVHPTNPQFFQDHTGKTVALAGHQSTVDYQDNAWWGITLGDLWGWSSYEDYLDYVVGTGMNYIRSWIVWHTSDPDGGPDGQPDPLATPMMYERSTTSGATDGGNRFDLTKLDQSFFDRVRERVSLMNDKGLYVSIMLFEVYGFMDLGSNNRWYRNPWAPNNNIQGVDIDDPAQGGNNDNQGIEFFYNYNQTVPGTGKTILDLQKEYVEKMVDTLHDMPNVIYEIANELRADDWQNAISAHIQAYETANYPGFEHLVYISASGRDMDGSGDRRTPTEALAMDADIVNWHGEFYDKTDPTAHSYNKPVIADMDHIDASATGETPDVNDPWKAVTRGYGFARYDGQAFKVHSTLRPDQDLQRNNIGALAAYLNQKATDPAAMTPQNSLSTSGYCLCSTGEEYLVYNPGTASFTVSGLIAGQQYSYEWYDTGQGRVDSAGSFTATGTSFQFSPPGGMANAGLFLQRIGLAPPSPTLYVPAEWNGTRTSVLRDRPVILPAQVAAGVTCDPTIYSDLDWDGTITTGTYDCIDDIPTIGHTIPASASVSQLAAQVNDTNNGTVFLFDVNGDWSNTVWEITRTDTNENNPLYLLPTDIATRTDGPWLQPSATLGEVRLRCDGANSGVGVDGLRVIGLRFSALTRPILFNMGYPGATCGKDGSSRNEDTVLAWNQFEDWGYNNSDAVGAITLRGSRIWVTNNWIYNDQNWYSLATQQRDVDGIRMKASSTYGLDWFIGRNFIRGVGGDHIVSSQSPGTLRRYAIEHNTLEWGPESRMDGDGSSSVLATLNPNGHWIGGENCIDLKVGSTGQPTYGGIVRGNVCIGQRLNNDNGGSSGGGGSAALDASWDRTEDIRIHGNFFLDTHTRCFAESNDEADLMDFSGNICEMNPAGINGGYNPSYQYGGVFPRFSRSRIANNTFKCLGPGVSGIVAHAGSNDITNNVIVDCDSATANVNGTPCVGCLEANVLRNTPVSSGDTSPIIDDSAEAYGDLVVTIDHPFFVGTALVPAQRTRTVTGVVPPEGSPAATAGTSLTFTPGRGTVFPMQRFYDQLPDEVAAQGAGAVSGSPDPTPPPIPPSGQVPSIDINGYQAYWERPIITGDVTLDTNWDKRALPWPQLRPGHAFLPSFTIDTDTLKTLNCSGTADTQSGWRVLKEPGDLAELVGTPSDPQYAICPGAYESFGLLNLGAGGSGFTDGQVRKVVCIRSDYLKNPTQINPVWDQRPDGAWTRPHHDYARECVLPRMDVSNRSNWFFQGVTFSHDSQVGPGPSFTGRTSGRMLRLQDGTSNILFDRVWMACFGTMPSGSSHDCVRFGLNGGSFNIHMQNSVISHVTPVWDADMNHISYDLNASDSRLVNTTLHEAQGHAILTGANSTTGGGHNNILENVDMHTSIRTQCGRSLWEATGVGTRDDGASGDRIVDVLGRHAGMIAQVPHGTIDPVLKCGIGQSKLAVKHGSADPNKPLGTVHIRITGGRAMDHKVSGDAPSDGTSLVGQQNPGNWFMSHINVEGTRFFAAAWTQKTGSNYSNMWLQFSRFWPSPEMEIHYGSRDFSNLRVFEFDDRCAQTPLCDGSDYTFVSNDIRGYDMQYAGAPADGLASVGTYDAEFSCNVITGSAMKATGTNVTGQENVLVDGADLSGVGVTGSTPVTTLEAELVPITFWTNLQTSSPVQITSPPIAASSSSLDAGCTR